MTGVISKNLTTAEPGQCRCAIVCNVQTVKIAKLESGLCSDLLDTVRTFLLCFVCRQETCICVHMCKPLAYMNATVCASVKIELLCAVNLAHLTL